VHHVCVAFFQYFYMLPSFVNIMIVYSFCNINDLSWGTKGLETGGGHGGGAGGGAGGGSGSVQDKIAEDKRKAKAAADEKKKEEKKKEDFQAFRSKMCGAWLVSNIGIGSVVLLELQVRWCNGWVGVTPTIRKDCLKQPHRRLH
jgi:chitin synthase